MGFSNQVPRYYISSALQTMELAYEHNQDPQVGTLISRAIDNLRQLSTKTSYPEYTRRPLDNDPYEVDDSNSAI